MATARATIASFEPDGRARLIDVKTTRGWERTRFHITPWDISHGPKAFELRPPLNAHVALTAITFEKPRSRRGGSFPPNACAGNWSIASGFVKAANDLARAEDRKFSCPLLELGSPRSARLRRATDRSVCRGMGMIGRRRPG
jgi:hypothetical protein